MRQQNNNTSAAGEDDDMSANNSLPRSSALEFKLRRLKYIGMLSSGDRTGAIAYARCHFPAFVGSHEREVQSLMGAVMYANGDDPRSRLLSSPYGKKRTNGKEAVGIARGMKSLVPADSSANSGYFMLVTGGALGDLGHAFLKI